MQLTAQNTVGFDDDVFFTRVRHGTAEVLLNRGSTGARLVDCSRGQLVGDIPYPDGIDDFSPYAVLIAPHGRTAYLFGSDLEDFAIELDLDARQSRKLRLMPPGGIFTSVGWLEPALCVVDVSGNVWDLRGETIEKRSRPEPLSSYGESLLWICQHYAVQKMDLMATGVYVFSATDDGGTAAGWIVPDRPPLFAMQRGDAIDLAHDRNELLICYDDRLVGHYGQTLLEARPGERFLAVETLNARGHVLALLVDVLAGVDTPNRELRLFRLEA
jgi:hypothetical protein